MLEGQIITDQIRKKYNIAYLMHGARNVGGGEYSIFFLIKNLRKDIFKPVVFYAHENEIVRMIQKEGIETITLPLHEKIISVYRDEIRYNPVSLCVYVLHLVAGILRIRMILKENKIVLLHPHDNLSKIIGGITAKIAGVKIVTHCRDGLRNNLIGNILKLVYLHLTDRVIVVSEKTAEFLRTCKTTSNGKVKTIYNGVDLKIFNPDRVDKAVRKELKISNNYIILGIVGVLEKYKGHVHLFEAMEKLKSDGMHNLKCIVVGKGREIDNLSKFVKDKSLSENILFLGYRKDIPTLLKAIDILVIPSIEQEAFPRVAIEAMAMKVPVVCSDYGGLPEAVIDGKTGIVVPTENTDALCKAIKYLIVHPEVRKVMGEAGRKRVEERFSIEINVRKTEELYLDVIGNS